jgi:hypothetical protein
MAKQRFFIEPSGKSWSVKTKVSTCWGTMQKKVVCCLGSFDSTEKALAPDGLPAIIAELEAYAAIPWWERKNGEPYQFTAEREVVRQQVRLTAVRAFVAEYGHLARPQRAAQTKGVTS